MKGFSTFSTTNFYGIYFFLKCLYKLLINNLPAVVRLSSCLFSTGPLIFWCIDFKNRSVVWGNDWKDKFIYCSLSSNAFITKADACSKSSNGTPLVSSPDIETRWKCGRRSCSLICNVSLVCGTLAVTLLCLSSRALKIFEG